MDEKPPAGGLQELPTETEGVNKGQHLLTPRHNNPGREKSFSLRRGLFSKSTAVVHRPLWAGCITEQRQSDWRLGRCWIKGDRAEITAEGWGSLVVIARECHGLKLDWSWGRNNPQPQTALTGDSVSRAEYSHYKYQVFKDFTWPFGTQIWFWSVKFSIRCLWNLAHPYIFKAET